MEVMTCTGSSRAEVLNFVLQATRTAKGRMETIRSV